MTADGWLRHDDAVAGWSCLIDKRDGAVSGWSVFCSNADVIYFQMNLAVADMEAYSAAGQSLRDSEWHHVVCYYNDTTKTGHVALDGIWGTAIIGNGAYQVDAALDLFFGVESTAANPFEGVLSWWRLSDNDRFAAGTDFSGNLPSRLVPPLVDGNTVEQWNMNEGAGTTAAAQVAAANNGTIANGAWEYG